MNEVKYNRRLQEISIGQFYQSGARTFLLHAVGEGMRVGLACLETGETWSGLHHVEDVRDVTPDEFRQIIGKGLFIRITSPITIIPD